MTIWIALLRGINVGGKNKLPLAKTLHFVFLDAPPKSPDLDAIEGMAVESESDALDGRVFYLHAPAGIGRSKLAAAAERKLGVTAASRNFNTVLKLSEMIGES